jgi:hypothetical protein
MLFSMLFCLRDLLFLGIDDGAMPNTKNNDELVNVGSVAASFHCNVS